jgi:hypothetical protein
MENSLARLKQTRQLPLPSQACGVKRLLASGRVARPIATAISCDLGESGRNRGSRGEAGRAQGLPRVMRARREVQALRTVAGLELRRAMASRVGAYVTGFRRAWEVWRRRTAVGDAPKLNT